MTKQCWTYGVEVDPAELRAVSEATGLSEVAAGILLRRGLATLGTAGRFLQPRLADLSDPYLLPDMAAAVRRIFEAVDRGEKVVLFGDYDVDGVTSVAQLQRALVRYGARVECFVPLRVEEGYGLSGSGVARCLELYSPDLIITVDCGTTSVEPIRLLRERGIDVIVLDHHECPDVLPECVAVVNPKRGADFHYLCTAGLAFKLVHALMKERRLEDFQIRQLLDLTAFGTVADLVPLRGENRTFVYHGLKAAGVSAWPGVRAFAKLAGGGEGLVARDVSFRIAPRLNAAGRIGDARHALEILLSDDPVRVEELMRMLDDQNSQRQSFGIVVKEELEGMFSLGALDAAGVRSVVAGSESWHPGVVGIAASHLVKTYRRPSFVVSFDATGYGKGSGRSVPGFPLVELLRECSEALVTFGGHDAAAGIGVRRERFEDFRALFEQAVRRRAQGGACLEEIAIEQCLEMGQLGLALCEDIGRLGPFGMGNEAPLFSLEGVRIERTVPRGERHIRLDLAQGSRRCSAIWFDGAGVPLPSGPADVAFELQRNEYNGRVEAQLRVVAVRASEACV